MNKVLQINGNAITLEHVEHKVGSVRFELNGKCYHFRAQRTENGATVLEEELAEGVWQATTGGMWQSGKNLKTVQLGALEARISDTAQGATAISQTAALSPVAPMPGLVRQVLVKKGDHVSNGHALVVIEAMKLQLSLAAGGDAIVSAVLVKMGDMVSEGAELVTLIAKK